MRFAVILENAPGCELDRAEFEVKPGARNANEVSAEDEISEKVKEAILEWTLSAGDAIKIVEL